MSPNYLVYACFPSAVSKIDMRVVHVFCTGIGPFPARLGEMNPERNMHVAQVSPHEFMQAVMAASSKRFTIDKQSDPVDFLSWFLNTLHSELTGGKRKKPSIITRCFQA
jgi:hypothetical protein